MNRIILCLALIALYSAVLSGSAAAQALSYPSQSQFSFRSTVRGRFKAVLRLTDAEGNMARRVKCMHSLWAGYQYGDEKVEGIRRLLTINTKRRTVVFETAGLPGIKENAGQKAAIQMMVLSTCRTREGLRDIESNADAQFVQCGAGPYPASMLITPNRWLGRLRGKLLRDVLF